tara:strand:- start:1404 stop:1826 length:423 start_codon:yes stop_codon:yes gene_type:complete
MTDYLGGAKRKNGHRMNCDCHICENIKKKHERGGYEEDREKKKLKLKGGPKKKNGHKPDCDCPICKNMKNKHGIKTKKYRGGGDDEEEEDDDADASYGGRKQQTRRIRKGNGHKPSCGCPICKNMRKGKMTRRHKTRRKR